MRQSFGAGQLAAPDALIAVGRGGVNHRCCGTGLSADRSHPAPEGDMVAAVVVAERADDDIDPGLLFTVVVSTSTTPSTDSCREDTGATGKTRGVQRHPTEPVTQQGLQANSRQ